MIEQEVELDRGTISKLLNGHEEFSRPNARSNLLKIITVFVLKRAMQSQDKANEFLRSGGFDELREDQDEDREVLKLFNKVLEKPKYKTIEEIPVVGRDQDIEKILNKLRDKDTRLIFLVGLPGVGKTEVARQVKLEAEKLGLFRYVRKLELTREVTNPDDVIKSLTDTLKGIPKQIRTLVLLHNCEQVEGRIGVFTQKLRDFLDDHKYVTILATSRKRMSRKKDDDFPVEPLSVPPEGYEQIETPQAYDTLNLFFEIAKDLSFTPENAEAIVAICRYCGGLPLAVNLATACIDELGVEGFFERLQEEGLFGLEDEFAESDWHKSLYNLIEISYNLLNDNDQRIFRRLAIIFHGCSIKTAQAVCDLNDLLLSEDDFFKALKKLSSHQLITFINKRIQIAHPLLEEYASVKVKERKDTEQWRLMRRYADYFLDTYRESKKWEKAQIFVFMGYNSVDTYEEALQEEILHDDLGLNIELADDYKITIFGDFSEYR